MKYDHEKTLNAFLLTSVCLAYSANIYNQVYNIILVLSFRFQISSLLFNNYIIIIEIQRQSNTTKTK